MVYFKILLRKILTLAGLSWKERSLLVQAFILLPLVAFSLQLWGMQRTQKALSQFSSQAISMSSEALLTQVQKTARIVGMATQYSQLWTNCLKKSLVLWFLLHRQGIVSELRIGVRRESGEFQAHAWVEYQGIILNDTPNVRSSYAMFESPIEVKAENLISKK
jgi:hypothetical protein